MFKKPESEKRVVLNCLVTPVTLAWLKSAGMSQGEAVDHAVACANVAEAQGRALPVKKVSRREREVAARAGRPEIDYADAGSTPMTHVATLDAVGPQASGRQGKASFQSWRAVQKPILKPGDRK